MPGEPEDPRSVRLAAALRANLRRRKAAIAGRAEAISPDIADPEPKLTRPKGAKVGG